VTTFIIIFAIIAVVGVALVVMFTADRLPGIAPATHDEAPRDEPQFPMTAADLATVQFGVRFRGYDMQEVDTFIDGLIDQLAVAEARANGDYMSTGWASPAEEDPETMAIPVTTAAEAATEATTEATAEPTAAETTGPIPRTGA
jgi:DivIVA domain-containing protein